MNDSGVVRVSVSDIQMPFWSMVVFMVKAAIASIPAFIILSIIGTLVFSVLAGISGGIGLLAPRRANPGATIAERRPVPSTLFRVKTTSGRFPLCSPLHGCPGPYWE